MVSDLITRLESLRTREHECLVQIVDGLVECLRTRAHLDLGYESLWKFLVERLGYSEGAASRRANAARVVERCPRALQLLRERRVTLCALARIRPVLHEVSDPDELLARIEGKGKTEVDREVAAVRPTPARRETVRRRFVRPAPPATQTESPFTSTVEAPAPSATSAAEAPVVERVALSFSLDPDAFAQFEKAKAILSRKLPAGVSLEAAFNELVQFFLSKKDPEQRATRRRTCTVEASAAPTTSTVEAPRSRHVPAALRDAIFLRDGHRCAFVGCNGHRCGSTHDLEIDHVTPFALGGRTVAENLRVLCGTHNRHRARRTFGSTGRGASPGIEKRPGRRRGALRNRIVSVYFKRLIFTALPTS
jgi:5-methylcytosine-specific restriction endonuclease McrA